MKAKKEIRKIMFYIAGITIGWWMRGFMTYYKEHEQND